MSVKLNIVVLIFIVGMLSGCQVTNENSLENNSVKATSEDIPWAQNYSNQDTGVLINIDETNETITIKKVDSGEKLELSYTGATDVTDKYSSVLVMKQIQIGELVNIYYNLEDSTIRKLEISPDAWEYTQVENLSYDRTENIISIAGEKYKYGDSFTLISNNQEIDLLDFNPIDIVTVKGYNKKICAVIVTRGHGYIKLENEETFVGGWIDIGQESAKPITEDMLVVASEGNHNVTVANNGAGGTKNVTVKRNEETVVDVGDLKSETTKSGSLKFTITPNTASLYIDGVMQDYSEVIVVDYGVHRIIVKASGHSDFSQTIVVGSTYAEIEIDATGSFSSNSSNSTETTGSTGTKGTTDATGTGTKETTTNHTGLELPGINGNTGTTSTTGTTGTTDTTNATDSAIVDALQGLLSD